jgi:Protein of unknown function (DUF5132)
MPKGDKKHLRDLNAAQPQIEESEGSALLTSAVLIGLGALVQPELAAGMVVGAGIVLVSRWMPNLIRATLRPVVSTAVKAGYSAVTIANEALAEAAEEVQDMLAEARAGQESNHQADRET